MCVCVCVCVYRNDGSSEAVLHSERKAYLVERNS